MRIPRIAAALLLACAAAPAAAQPAVLRPGSTEVSTHALTDRTDEFVVEAGDADAGGRVPVGRMTLRTRLATRDGVEVVARTETVWVDDERVQVDSFTLHRRTLAPLAVHSAAGGRGVELAFAPGGVRRVSVGGRSADTAHLELAEPAFAAGTTDLLLGALPLAAGYSARLAVFDAGVDTVAVKVQAAEQVPLPGGGSAAAWRVAVREGEQVSTYWMDRESHTLVQFQSADGTVRMVRSRAGHTRARPTR